MKPSILFLGRRVLTVATPIELATAALVLCGSSLAAQQGPVRVRIEGVVVDSATRVPVGSARVMPVGPGHGGVLTDDQGRFSLSLLATDSIRLLVDQIGYRTVRLSLPFAAVSSPIEVALGVDPLAIEGLDVVVGRQGLGLVIERHETRRRSYPGSSYAIPRRRIVESTAFDAGDLLRGFLPATTPCDNAGFRDMCLSRRGRPVAIKICIDDVRAVGGFTQLASYTPQDIYSVEYYDRGRLVLIYTRDFMRRAMSRQVWVSPDPNLAC